MEEGYKCVPLALRYVRSVLGEGRKGGREGEREEGLEETNEEWIEIAGGRER